MLNLNQTELRNRIYDNLLNTPKTLSLSLSLPQNPNTTLKLEAVSSDFSLEWGPSPRPGRAEAQARPWCLAALANPGKEERRKGGKDGRGGGGVVTVHVLPLSELEKH